MIPPENRSPISSPKRHFKLISEFIDGSPHADTLPKMFCLPNNEIGMEEIRGLRLDDLLSIPDIDPAIPLEALFQTLTFTLEIVDLFGVLLADRNMRNVFLTFYDSGGDLIFRSTTQNLRLKQIDFGKAYDLIGPNPCVLAMTIRQIKEGKYLEELSAAAKNLIINEMWNTVMEHLDCYRRNQGAHEEIAKVKMMLVQAKKTQNINLRSLYQQLHTWFETTYDPNATLVLSLDNFLAHENMRRWTDSI